MVPGEIQPLGGVGHQQRNVFQDRLFPARAAVFSQVWFEQPVRFQPHVRVPIAVQARFVQSLLVLTRQQVSDPNGLSQHPGVVITDVGRMLFCVEHRRRQDGVRKMPPSCLCFDLFEPGARQVVQAPFDGGGSGFQQPEVAGRERVGGLDRGADRSPQQSKQQPRAMGFHARHFYGSLLDNNIKGTYNVFRAAKDAGCRRVVFASSIHAVVGYPADMPIPTDVTVRPLNMYGVSKCFGEAVAAAFAYGEGLSAIAIRIGAYEAPWLGPPQQRTISRSTSARATEQRDRPLPGSPGGDHVRRRLRSIEQPQLASRPRLDPRVCSATTPRTMATPATALPRTNQAITPVRKRDCRGRAGASCDLPCRECKHGSGKPRRWWRRRRQSQLRIGSASRRDHGGSLRDRPESLR